MSELLESLVALSRRAGEAILAVYRERDHGVVTKTDQSPVTRADHAAHGVIAAGLPALMDLPILSEEGRIPSFEIRRQWQRYWLIDPLDGTREFIRRNDQFTVNIALVEDGRPVLGVVYAPVSMVTYVGDIDGGAFRIDPDGGRRRLATRKMAERGSDESPITIMVSSRHGTGRAADLIRLIRSRLGTVEVVKLGSSLKSCRVAEGAADLYPRYGPTSEWDTGAAQAVLEAAGGALVDKQMRPLRYNQRKSLINPSFFALGDADFDWVDCIDAMASE